MGEFIVTLGLLHDPCPYLSEDYRCKVYSARPLGCAVFPLHLLIDSSPQLKTNYKGYQCIRDVSLSEGQKRLGQELRILLRESAEIDFEFFWKKEPIYISTQTTADYFSLASQAIEAQMSLGRNKNHPRVKKMLQAVFEMQRIVDTREVLNGFAPDSYRALLSPVVYCLLEKEIADRMKVVDKSAIDAYRKIDQRWYELSREAH